MDGGASSVRGAVSGDWMVKVWGGSWEKQAFSRSNNPFHSAGEGSPLGRGPQGWSASTAMWTDGAVALEVVHLATAVAGLQAWLAQGDDSGGHLFFNSLAMGGGLGWAWRRQG